jgi:phytoene dehydrogenase-like protein
VGHLAVDATSPKFLRALTYDYDAVVVGSGPNGLAAAITLAEHGCSVLVLEAASSVGGGMRTMELTLPGFQHDVCSAIHPMAILSPFFRHLALEPLGLRWIEPPLALAHPLDDGQVGQLHKSIAETAAELHGDGKAYEQFVGPLVESGHVIFDDLLKPIGITRHPWLMLRFALAASVSAERLGQRRFHSPMARALFAGCAAHSFLPLAAPFSSAIGLTLMMAAHLVNWPLPKGGSGSIALALGRQLSMLGGKIATNEPITAWRKIPSARAILFDTSIPTLLSVCGHQLPTSYVERLQQFRTAPGVFKLDWALSEPIPWKNKTCARAGTVHVGGELEEIARAEADVNQGKHPERPFVLVTQPTLFDDTRAPQDKHTAWAYCHVPNGSVRDMTAAIESQIERFAPGFGGCILARHRMNTVELNQYNANYVGGDITGGANDFRQMLMRPTLGPVPYATPRRGVYLCSSSTPPGGGVHGMCGYNAARAALRDVFGIRVKPYAPLAR